MKSQSLKLYTEECLFRIPEHGGRVLWQVTNVCNYSCPYCIFASGPTKISGELTTEAALRTIRELADAGFTHIKFTGGEPFARKDMIQLLEAASSAGLSFDISTNASLITAEVAARLAATNVEMVHVSLDGHTSDLQEEIRGEKSYSPTLRGLTHLRNTSLYLRVGCVVCKANEHQLTDYTQACVELGIDKIAFSLLEPAGRIAGDYSVVATTPTGELIQEIEMLTKDYEGQIEIQHNMSKAASCSADGRCPGGERFLYIDNLGRISPCTWVVKSAPEYRTTETLLNNTLGELLESEPLTSYQRYLSDSGKTGCPMKWAIKEVAHAA